MYRLISTEYKNYALKDMSKKTPPDPFTLRHHAHTKSTWRTRTDPYIPYIGLRYMWNSVIFGLNTFLFPVPHLFPPYLTSFLNVGPSGQ